MKFTLNLKKAVVTLLINRVHKHKRVVVFNFHQVAKEFHPHYHNRGTFTQIDFFEQQIRYIKDNFKVISLYEAIQKANANMLDDNYAAITFDDGDKSILDAMDVLKKYAIPATFFINSGYVDNKAACWFHIYQYIKNNEKYTSLLTPDIEQNYALLRTTTDKELYQKYSKKIEDLFVVIEDDFDMFVSFDALKKVDKDLFHIALHGYEHQRFSMMSAAWQEQNLKKDIALLATLPAYKPIFALPFGRPHDWVKESIHIAMDLDLEIVFADGGINTHREIGYKRIPADGRELRKLV